MVHFHYVMSAIFYTKTGTSNAEVEIFVNRTINGVEYADIPVMVELHISQIGSDDPDDGPEYEVISAKSEFGEIELTESEEEKAFLEAIK